MRKLAPIFILLIITMHLAIAANLDVEVSNKKRVIIVESGENATFTLSITNLDIKDRFEIYSLVGIRIYPKYFFTIETNETLELDIIVSPHKETKRDFRGFYVFEYQIKGKETGFYIDRLTIEILDVKDAIQITSENIDLNDEEITLTIKNLKDFNFEDLTIKVKSPFFEHAEIIDLSSLQEKEISVSIDKEKTKSLSAGEYEIEITFELSEITSEGTSTVKYLEKGGISIREESEGFVIRKRTITKRNEGNINSTATINLRKNVLSRLFTTHSEAPLTSIRKGLSIDYSWEKKLSPDEEFSITSTTNYTIPFILIIIIIFVIAIVKFTISKDLSLQKRVAFMKTKGGEFALKVKVRVKARKSLENIKIIEKLPGLTKLYEKFGSKPDKIDHKTRRIMWNIKRLNAGEERVFTYIIYSKVNIIGRFELPAAHATYEKPGSGKVDKAFSNKAYFAAESSEDPQVE